MKRNVGLALFVAAVAGGAYVEFALGVPSAVRRSLFPGLTVGWLLLSVWLILGLACVLRHNGALNALGLLFLGIIPLLSEFVIRRRPLWGWTGLCLTLLAAGQVYCMPKSGTAVKVCCFVIASYMGAVFVENLWPRGQWVPFFSYGWRT